MTAVEFLHALKYGLWHIYALPLPLWSRIQLMFLKAVAICGYYYGKYLFLQGHETTRLSRSGDTEKSHVDPPPLIVPRSKDVQHKVAIIIPVYATTHEYVSMVREAIDALCRQTREPELVLVVDDFSPIHLPESIARNVSSGKDTGRTVVRVLKLSRNCGPAVARNEGLYIAKREGATLVLFLDGDCIPDPSWVGAMEKQQTQFPGIVGGRTLSFDAGTAVGRYHDLCGTLNGRLVEDGSLLYGCTCNMSLDTSVVDFQFDTTFPRAAFEDVEFCVRARKKGISITYKPTAVVKHRYEPGWWGLFHRFQRYGSFEGHMCVKHPEYLSWLWSSQEIPSIAVT